MKPDLQRVVQLLTLALSSDHSPKPIPGAPRSDSSADPCRWTATRADGEEPAGGAAPGAMSNRGDEGSSRGRGRSRLRNGLLLTAEGASASQGRDRRQARRTRHHGVGVGIECGLVGPLRPDHGQEHRHRNEQEGEQVVEELAVGELAAPDAEGQFGEVELAEDREQGTDEVVHEGLDDRSECEPDDDADGEVERSCGEQVVTEVAQQAHGFLLDRPPET